MYSKTSALKVSGGCGFAVLWFPSQTSRRARLRTHPCQGLRSASPRYKFERKCVCVHGGLGSNNGVRTYKKYNAPQRRGQKTSVARLPMLGQIFNGPLPSVLYLSIGQERVAKPHSRTAVAAPPGPGGRTPLWSLGPREATHPASFRPRAATALLRVPRKLRSLKRTPAPNTCWNDLTV